MTRIRTFPKPALFSTMKHRVETRNYFNLDHMIGERWSEFGEMSAVLDGLPCYRPREVRHDVLILLLLLLLLLCFDRNLFKSTPLAYNTYIIFIVIELIIDTRLMRLS